VIDSGLKDWAESSGDCYFLSNGPPAGPNLKENTRWIRLKQLMAQLLYQDLGRLEFLSALSRQEELLKLKQREGTPDILLFVEHPHVYTIGRSGDLNNVLDAQDVPLHRSSRGGDVTYHGPGQLVVYPIIDLRSKLRRDVHRYVRNLEMTAIETLKDFGIEAARHPPFTGIWCNNRKIAAIGIAVRRCITFHGLAMNVNTDLNYFNRIIPCGLAWADVTSMAQELGKEQSIEQVKYKFLNCFAEAFDYSAIEDLFDLSAFQAGQKAARYETRDDR
jgi:lipoate-protein ligase B